MNYLNIYNKIIQNALKREQIQNKYYEIHHIVPKCLGGNNDESNLVYLTLKEHYICHQLLCEIYPDNKSIAHAYWMMTIMTIGALENFKNDNLYRIDGYLIKRCKSFINGEKIRISAREYAWCREHWRNLVKGIKRNKEQCKRISDKTKQAMKSSEAILKCRANKGSHYYHEIKTGKVHKWFPGDQNIDLNIYAWGRGHISDKQKAKLSQTQCLNKTCCKIGNTNYRYCWYKDYINNIPNILIDQHCKNKNNLKRISHIIINALGYLKENNIFIDDYIIIRPFKRGLTIISPSIYEIIIDLLENNINDYKIIGDRIYQNIEKIKILNKKYINQKFLVE